MGLLILGFCFMNTRTVSVQERYMDRYKFIAKEEMKRAGIPASIKMAQGIMESMAGRSELAVNANNHFGIKCKSNWPGQTYFYKDDDYDTSGNLVESCFRLYPSPEESYFDHSEFLRNRSRYKSLFDLSISDYKGWAQGLKKCGYATDPMYAMKLVQTIEKYNLDFLDQEVLKDMNSNSIPVELDKPVMIEISTSVTEPKIEPTSQLSIKSALPIQRQVKKPYIPQNFKGYSIDKSRFKRKKLYK